MAHTTSTSPAVEGHGFVRLACTCGWDAGMALHPVRATYFADFHRELFHSGK